MAADASNEKKVIIPSYVSLLSTNMLKATADEDDSRDDNIYDEGQESAALEAVSLATPMTEFPLSTKGEVTSKPTSRSESRSRVRFEEDEGAPEKPPRPMSPRQQAEITLIEAFPSIDAKVVKAVLTASGGQVEPAFNALLGKYHPWRYMLHSLIQSYRHVRS